MHSKWPIVTLNDVAIARNGAGIKQSFFAETGIPLARVSNFSAGTINLRDCVNIELEHAQRWKSHQLKIGDVLVATVGSWPPNWNSVVGKVVRIPKQADGAIQNQNTCCVLGYDAIADQRFLYYLLSTEKFTHYAANSAAGSASQARLSVANLMKFQFSLPSLEDQKRISKFLGSLDDRIDNLLETNTTLEAIAQALFKSWFVDFDPVRAKAEGREPEGIDAETAALFPDGFDESELGLVPKGWIVGKLSDIANLNSESWTNKNHPDTVVYVDLANTKDNSINEVSRYRFSAAPSRARRILRDGDTIIGTVRPGNRSFAFIHNAPSNLTASTGFAVLRPIDVINTEFLYLAVTASSSIDFLAHVADGGAYPAVRSEVVANIKVVLPSSEIMTAYHVIAKPFLEKIVENQQKTQTLADIRDTLLPRLISGQLRLSEGDMQRDASWND